MPKPVVLPAPNAFIHLKEGFDQLADLLALTMGPVGGVVLSTTEYHEAPELLNDAAVIARRILALPDRSQNVGAMLMRNLVWRVHQRVGDGGSLTAVLAQALLDHAALYVTAGASPVYVNQGIKRAVAATTEALAEMSQPIQDEADLAAIAHSVTMQPDLSLVLGEMFDLLGEHAYITIENYLAPYLERTYITGGRWKAGLVSPYLITAPATREAILQDAWVVIFDGDVDEGFELTNLFTLAQEAVKTTQKPFNLLIYAKIISGEGLNTLVSAHTQGLKQEDGGLRVIAVEAKRVGDGFRSDLIDLATLTGAEVISPQLGRTLGHVRQADLGFARRVVASSDELFVIDGKGEAGQIRDQIQIMQKQLQAIQDEIHPENSPDQGQSGELGMRIARLTGSAAVLKIGAVSKAERDVQRQKAEQGVKAIKAAMEEGVVLGGGVAYAHCVAAVEALTADSQDEKMGFQAVARALEAPFIRILENAHIDGPAVILDDLRHMERKYVYDVLRKEIVAGRPAGVLDAAKVLRIALETAASGVMLALNTGVVVLKRKPDMSYEP